ALIISLLLVVTMLGACSSGGGNTNGNGSSTVPEPTNEGTTNESPTEATTEATTYPINTDKKLTYWGELNGNLVGVKAAHDDVPFFQEWQKVTGVDLEFTAPP